ASADSLRRAISRPPRTTEPLVGISSPPRMERSVVLPLPLAPQMRPASPAGASRFTSRRTTDRKSVGKEKSVGTVRDGSIIDKNSQLNARSHFLLLSMH